MDNSVDNTTGMGYNSPQNDENVILVKMDEQRPANDTDCKHETLIPNKSDRIGEAIYYGCSNPKCGRGFYLQSPRDLKK